MLVASMNPCPCGYLGSGVRACRCSRLLVERYQSRISGPMLDRIDLRVEVGQVPADEIDAGGARETSAAVRLRVNAARQVQQARYRGTDVSCNAQIGARQLGRFCAPSPGATRLLNQAVARMGLSMRGRDRVRKVARTIADLAGSADIAETHVAEALQYRGSDGLGG
jgi:magnesium chelatase family protein